MYPNQLRIRAAARLKSRRKVVRLKVSTTFLFLKLRTVPGLLPGPPARPPRCIGTQRRSSARHSGPAHKPGRHKLITRLKQRLDGWLGRLADSGAQSVPARNPTALHPPAPTPGPLSRPARSPPGPHRRRRRHTEGAVGATKGPIWNCELSARGGHLAKIATG